MNGRMPVRQLRFSLLRDTRISLRYLYAAGFLLLNLALMFIASKRQPILVLLPFIGVGLVLTSLRWPSLGLIVASLAGMVVPFQGPSGLNVTMMLVAMLLVLWLLEIVVLKRQIGFALSRAELPLLLFLVIAFLSFGVGQLPWFSFASHAPLGAQLGGLSIFVLSASTFLLVANQVHELRWLSRLTWAFLVFGAFFVLIRSVLPELGLSTRGWLQPLGSVFFIWLVAMAFSQSIFNRDLRPGWRFALGGVVFVTTYILFFLKYDDKSGWVPVFASLAVILGLRSWRAGLVLVPIAILAALGLKSGVVDSDQYSIATRIDAWLIMAQIIKLSPIWGMGFANYYWYTPLFPIRGYEVSFNSHNNYVDIIAQTGLIGLFCFLWFLWEIGRLAWRLKQQVPAGFAQAYVYGVMGGLVGTIVVMMLGDWVLPFFYNVGLNGFRGSMLAWLFLGGLVSLEQMQLLSRSKA